MCCLHVDPTKLFAHAVQNHDDLVALVAATPAETDLDSALTAVVASELLGIRKRHEVSLNVSLLDLADADVVVSIVANDLDFLIVVTWTC